MSKQNGLSGPMGYAPCALLGLLVITVIFPASAFAHRLPPYIVGHGQSLVVYSNERWVKSGRPSVHATEIVELPPSTEGDDPRYSVWLGECKTGQQTIRLKRIIELPGPPSKEILGHLAPLKLQVSDYNGYDKCMVRLYFNNHRVYRSEGVVSGEINLPAAANKWLKAGKNEVEIVLTKPEGSCSYFRGVVFGLLGSFKADLEVGLGEPVVYQHELTSTNIINIRNRGTSTVYHAKFHLGLQSGFLLDSGHYEYELDFANWEGPFFKSCEVTPPSDTVHGYALDCELINMKPGETGKVWATIKYTPDFVPFDHDIPTWSYEIRPVDFDGPYDPVYDNNYRAPIIYFCGDLATVPGCQ
jgi:hypothetical protein